MLPSSPRLRRTGWRTGRVKLRRAGCLLLQEENIGKTISETPCVARKLCRAGIHFGCYKKKVQSLAGVDDAWHYLSPALPRNSTHNLLTINGLTLPQTPIPAQFFHVQHARRAHQALKENPTTRQERNATTRIHISTTHSQQSTRRHSPGDTTGCLLGAERQVVKTHSWWHWPMNFNFGLGTASSIGLLESSASLPDFNKLSDQAGTSLLCSRHWIYDGC